MPKLRRIDPERAERVVLIKEHGSLTADTTVKLYKVATGRAFRLTRTLYINVTGLTGDPTNAFALLVQNGATVAATAFNTDTDDNPAGATLTADTFFEGTLSSTSANRVFAAGDTVSLVFDEDGTSTLPAGTIILEGLLF